MNYANRLSLVSDSGTYKLTQRFRDDYDEIFYLAGVDLDHVSSEEEFHRAILYVKQYYAEETSRFAIMLMTLSKLEKRVAHLAGDSDLSHMLAE